MIAFRGSVSQHKRVVEVCESLNNVANSEGRAEVVVRALHTKISASPSLKKTKDQRGPPKR